MIEVRTPEEVTRVMALLRRGFSPRTARRLADALRRHEAGEYPELAGSPRRLLFASWLIEHGRLTDWPTELATDLPL